MCLVGAPIDQWNVMAMELERMLVLMVEMLLVAVNTSPHQFIQEAFDGIKYASFAPTSSVW